MADRTGSAPTDAVSMTSVEGMGRADPVLSVDPTDDVGAETLDRFAYQAHLVAARCASMLLDSRIQAVICEWHEDYVVQFANGPSELVSVKHHDGGQSHWTVKDLCKDGGLRHLFGRFVRLGEKCTCRLQTNEQLRSGAGRCAELRDACASGDSAAVAGWAVKLASDLGSGDIDQVGRFLGSLKIEDGLPDRRMIETIHLQDVMPRLAAKLSFGQAEHHSSYASLHALAMSAGSAPGGPLVFDALCDPDALSRDADKARALSAKTIDRERALRALGRSGVPRLLLTASVDPAPARTRLVKKLEAGGMGPTTVNMARRLKANWDSHREGWSSGLPGDADAAQHLTTRVVRLAGTAEVRTRTPGSTYGGRMFDELERLIEESDLMEEWTGPLNTSLLLGLAFERTEACEIFWSDEFDPDGVP